MYKIAIVEDNLDFDNALQQIISSIPTAQYFGSFSTGETAIKAIPSLQPDIVIVDIKLKSSVTGIDVISLIKPVMGKTQFLVCTMYDDSNLVFTALKSGASGYILKEAGSEEIKRAIIEIANGGSPMSPFIARKVIASFQKPHEAVTTKQSELTTREQQVLLLVSKGLLYKEIADQLAITHATVKKHLCNIYEKLHVQNKIEAINKYNAVKYFDL